MAHKKGSKNSIAQKGYSAARRNGPPDIAGWYHPKEKKRKDKKKRAGTPGDGPVALFGIDDEYVATFDGHTVTVTPFSHVGEDAKASQGTHIELEFEAIKAYSAGQGAPLLIYVIDTRGHLWSIDFRLRQGRTNTDGINPYPLCLRLAETLKRPIHHIVVLRRTVILQTAASRGGGYYLYALNRRASTVAELGGVNLEMDLAALDPTRHDILLGRQEGEQRLILLDEASTGTGARIEVHTLDMPRVQALTTISGTHLVVARKGGIVDKVDMRAVVPQQAAVANPLTRVCYLLRELLKRCGCDCNCNDVPGGGDGNGNGTGTGDDEPCDDRHSARLGFNVYRFHRAGTHLVALDRSATRMAVLDNRLNVLFERKLDRAGADVHAGQAHTQNLLVYMPGRRQVEAWGLADYIGEIDVRLPDDLSIRPMPPMPSVTFWGQRHQRAVPNPTLNVCIFPVIEPGQAFVDPDMSKLMAQVSSKIFTKVDNYYNENSFGEMSIDFATFGFDIGGTRTPLVLPRAMASYWRDSFRPGGLEAVMSADWSDPVVLDGSEELEIQANPRAGAVKTYNLPFAALWTSGTFSTFPVNINFDGTETLELTVETQDGDTHVLSVSFPAISLTLNQGGDVAGFLNDLGTHFTDAIRTAEATLPGSPTLIQDVEFRRVRTTSNATQFGLLQGRFQIEPVALADVTQKGQISVTGPATIAPVLMSLGMNTFARTGVLNSAAVVASYFRECLRAAQVDAGEGIGGSAAYFNVTPSTQEDTIAEEITVQFRLTSTTGGQMATMEVVSSSGLAGTGWDVAMPDPGSESNPNNSNTLRDSIELADDTFTAALEHIRATTAWDRATVEALFADFDVMMIAHVGAPHPDIPLADQWNADDPVDFQSKRMYKRSHWATDLNPPSGEDPVQMGTYNITGQRFNRFSGSDLNNQAGVMAHELGHALGLPDLYPAVGYRDDVDYVDPWAMMGGGNSNFHHFCAWSKWALGWIPDDPDPNINRTIFVDLPAASGVSVTEAWLVPIEYWDNSIRDDVRDEVGGSIEIGQLMKLNLGSDGGVTAFLELRADGALFSQNLSPEPTVIATNGLDPSSDRSWAVNGLYRRSVHLLNNGTELRAINDTWDFASAPEFPVKGCTAEVMDIRTIRGSIPVYLVRVEREQAEYIDLHFQDHVPSWKSPDIWVDWTGDNPDPNVPRTYPVGTPTDQGETVRFPGSGTEKHFVVARVHNAGNADAEEVKVRWFVCDPPGAGDDGRWVNRGTQTIPLVSAESNELAPFVWSVDAATNEHQCMRMEIIDWTIPDAIDPATGDTVALASDDVKLQNNNAQQNVFDFEALSGSPYSSIHFLMQVHNDRNRTEVAALVPEGLPYGSKLTISPREWAIPTGEARVFNCTLELDEHIIRPGCDNDKGFLLTAWRRGGEADENWGSCFYYVRPRYKTGLELVRGTWYHGQVRVYGLFRALTDTPLDLNDDMPLFVRIRMLVDGPGGPVHWRTVQVQSNGSFSLDTQGIGGKSMIVQAWFDRKDRLGSSVSNELQLSQSFIE